MPNGPDDDSHATLTPLRGIDLRALRKRHPVQRREEPALWFVTITVSGERIPPEQVRAGLERLSVEQPFLVSAGYASTRAEVRYWDESVDVEGAVSQALRMWGQHVTSAALPPWRIVGIEVMDRETARRRWDADTNLQVIGLGEIRPMDGAEL